MAVAGGHRYAIKKSSLCIKVVLVKHTSHCFDIGSSKQIHYESIIADTLLWWYYNKMAQYQEIAIGSLVITLHCKAMLYYATSVARFYTEGVLSRSNVDIPCCGY
jgi:hypothetical protein